MGRLGNTCWIVWSLSRDGIKQWCYTTGFVGDYGLAGLAGWWFHLGRSMKLLGYIMVYPLLIDINSISMNPSMGYVSLYNCAIDIHLISKNVTPTKKPDSTAMKSSIPLDNDVPAGSG